MLRMILSLTLVAAAAPVQPGEAQPLRRAVALLDYVSGDYARAVGEHGELLSPAEHQEQIAFLEAAARELRADASDVLRASPARVVPPCPWAGPGRCGGCDWQHVAIDEQRQLKAKVGQGQLRRLAGVERDVEVELVPGDVNGLGWRTRVRFAVDPAGRAGL